MRTVLSSILPFIIIGVGFAGCGGGSDKVDLGAKELGVSSPDLTMFGPDTCAQVSQCASKATTSAAIDGCVALGTQSAQAAFESLYDCITMSCPGNEEGQQDDMLNNACETDLDGGAVDPSACTACQMAAQATGGPCITQYNACVSETM